MFGTNNTDEYMDGFILQVHARSDGGSGSANAKDVADIGHGVGEGKYIDIENETKLLFCCRFALAGDVKGL